MQRNKTLNALLWIAQGLLAAMFLMAGGMKIITPIEDLAKQIPWVRDVPEMLVRIIGITDLLAALGIVLPLALHIKPVLAVWAALGMITTMVLAIVFHSSRGEVSVIGLNIILIALAIFVYWGRTKKARYENH